MTVCLILWDVQTAGMVYVITMRTYTHVILTVIVETIVVILAKTRLHVIRIVNQPFSCNIFSHGPTCTGIGCNWDGSYCDGNPDCTKIIDGVICDSYTPYCKWMS
jgi:hypothetical protein